MSQASRSLANIVGSRQDLVGTAWVDPGTVMIVLKNGRPLKVVGTGRSYKRGWRLPVLGQLAGIPISTAAHVVKVDVTDVGTRSEFHVPRVTVTFEVRLRSGGDWASLLAYVNREGVNFAERLEPRVRAELEQVVRTELGGYDYDQLFRANLIGFLPTGGSLLEDLFEILGVVHAHAEPNPSYRGIAVGKEETLAGVALAGQGGLVGLAEFEAEKTVALARALASGRSLDSILNGDLASADRDALLQVLTKLIENPHAGAITQVRDFVAQATSSFMPQAGGGAAPGPAPVEALAGMFATPELRIDHTLAGVFAAYDLLPAVKGLAWARRQAATAVLCVTDSPERIEGSRAELEAAASDATKARATLYVTRHDQALPAMLGSYLASRVPAFASTGPRVDARLAGGRLEIVLDTDGPATIDLRHTIRDPNELILEPLKQLLPYDSVDVVPV